jgi:hypothetical protein
MIGAGYVDVERLTMSFGVKRVARYFRDAGCRVLAGVLPDELVRSLMGEIRMAAWHGGPRCGTVVVLENTAICALTWGAVPILCKAG